MQEQDYEQLMLSLEDSLVSPSVWLESKKGKTTTVTYGLRCSELSENLRRVALSVRTYLESSALPPGKWSRIWSKRAITLSCSILKLRLSALSIEENVSHSLDTGTPILWKTPVAADAENREFYRNSRGEPNLSGQVKLWPTPAARDYKGANSMEHILKPGGGLNHMGQLPNAVEKAKLFATHTSAIAHGTTGGGNCRDLRNDVIGQLNPTWVEWLMGFPIGWTDLNASETPSCHSSSTQSSSL